MKFDLENPLTGFDGNEENGIVSALFDTESDHTPSFFPFKSTDVRFSIRHHSFTLISQAQFSYNIDRFTAYLAVNYIDRFLSKQVVLENKPWIVRILVIASLSLAAKMRSISLLISHIINPISDSMKKQFEQRDEGLNFDLQSVHRMESLILTMLNWRLRSITPFAFLQFFNSLFELSESPPSQSLEDRASDIIFSSHYGGTFELLEEITVETSSSLTLNSMLDQERTSPQSEINPNTNNSSKMRRLNDFQNDHQTFHNISQVQHC